MSECYGKAGFVAISLEFSIVHLALELEKGKQVGENGFINSVFLHRMEIE